MEWKAKFLSCRSSSECQISCGQDSRSSVIEDHGEAPGVAWQLCWIAVSLLLTLSWASMMEETVRAVFHGMSCSLPIANHLTISLSWIKDFKLTRAGSKLGSKDCETDSALTEAT